MAKKKVLCADLFCGAGGTSTGLQQACDELGLELELVAVNHWPTAIDTHTKNHPNVRHLCASLDGVSPREVVPGGRLHLLCASPECTHFSNARGGKPVHDQKRTPAFVVLQWLEALYVDNFVIENVPEFMNWGPLNSNGRPNKKRRGETFRMFIKSIESLDYKVEYKVLTCADYGDPTTRKRLFIVGSKRRAPSWPVPSHAKTAAAQSDLFNVDLKPWCPAREIIDWGIQSKSIFERKKPLALTTLKRIEAGLIKFGGTKAAPYLVILRQHMDAMSLDNPAPTVTASGNHIGLVEIAERPMDLLLGQQSGSAARPVSEPVPTVAASGAISLVEPFVLTAGGPKGQGRNARSVSEPMKTVLTDDRQALIETKFLVTANHGTDKDSKDGGHARRAKSLDDPLHTITGAPTHALVEASVEPMVFHLNRTKDDPRPTDRPLMTVTATSNDLGLAEFLVPLNHGKDDTRSQSVDEPMKTITSFDAHGLVEPSSGVRFDIRFRMLQPHELARAQGFPDSYVFTGTRDDRVKMIGNAVPLHTAKALTMATLARYAKSNSVNLEKVA